MASNNESHSANESKRGKSQNLPSIESSKSGVQKRLNSYKHQPTPHMVNPTNLAKNGFVYSKRNQATICQHCRQVVKNWKIDDKPEDREFHKEGCDYIIPANVCVEELNKPEMMEVSTLPSQNTQPSDHQPFAAALSNTQPATIHAVHEDQSESRNLETSDEESLQRRILIENLATQLRINSTSVQEDSPTTRISSGSSQGEDVVMESAVAREERPSRYPIVNSSVSDSPEDDLDMKVAANRLATFQRYWPRESAFKNFRILVESGFFCIGQDDAVKCFYCNTILANWNRNDNPRGRHLECSPQCRFAQGENCGNVPLTRESGRQVRERHERHHESSRPSQVHEPSTSQETEPAAGPIPVMESEEEEQQLPEAYNNPSQGQIERSNLMLQFPCENPANPAMREERARLETFMNSRFRYYTDLRANNQTLAEAGLYYTGEQDLTKCWFCNGGLKDFMPGDNPWVEHAKFFPECEYLLQQRGPEWVSNISAQFPNIERPQLPRRRDEIREVVSGPTVIHTVPQIPEASLGQENPILEAAMQTEPVAHARTMEFSEELIREVQMRKIVRTGSCYQSTEALLEALVNPNADPEDLEGAQAQAPSSQNTIEISRPGSRITIRGGNFIGPNIVNGRVIRTSGGASNEILFNGIPLEDYMDQESSTNEGGTAHVFNNFGELVSVGGPGEELPGPSNTIPEDLPAPTPTPTGTTEEQLEAYRKEFQCKICYNALVQVLFEPCGHVCACANCARRLTTCPVCRRHITRQRRTYHV